MDKIKNVLFILFVLPIVSILLLWTISTTRLKDLLEKQEFKKVFKNNIKVSFSTFNFFNLGFYGLISHLISWLLFLVFSEDYKMFVLKCFFDADGIDTFINEKTGPHSHLTEKTHCEYQDVVVGTSHDTSTVPDESFFWRHKYTIGGAGLITLMLLIYFYNSSNPPSYSPSEAEIMRDYLVFMSIGVECFSSEVDILEKHLIEDKEIFGVNRD